MDDVVSLHLWVPASLPLAAPLWSHSSLHLVGKGEQRRIWSEPHFGLFLVVAGQGAFRSDGLQTPVRRGDMFCFWPHVWTEWGGDPDDPWELYAFSLTGQSAPEVVQALGFELGSRRIRPRDFREAKKIFQRIQDSHRTRWPEDAYRMIAALYSLIPACVQPGNLSPDRNPSSENLVHRVAAIADTFSDGRLSMPQVAHACHVSRATLYRAFRKQFVMAPSRYFSAARLEKAKKILRETGEKISSVARAAGFSNAGALHRQFRRLEGITPSEYRKRFRGAD